MPHSSIVERLLRGGFFLLLEGSHRYFAFLQISESADYKEQYANKHGETFPKTMYVVRKGEQLPFAEAKRIAENANAAPHRMPKRSSAEAMILVWEDPTIKVSRHDRELAGRIKSFRVDEKMTGARAFFASLFMVNRGQVREAVVSLHPKNEHFAWSPDGVPRDMLQKFKRPFFTQEGGIALLDRKHSSFFQMYVMAKMFDYAMWFADYTTAVNQHIQCFDPNAIQESGKKMCRLWLNLLSMEPAIVAAVAAASATGAEPVATNDGAATVIAMEPSKAAEPTTKYSVQTCLEHLVPFLKWLTLASRWDKAVEVARVCEKALGALGVELVQVFTKAGIDPCSAAALATASNLTTTTTSTTTTTTVSSSSSSSSSNSDSNPASQSPLKRALVSEFNSPSCAGEQSSLQRLPIPAGSPSFNETSSALNFSGSSEIIIIISSSSSSSSSSTININRNTTSN